ncbi:hypothetical protein ABFX02_08G109000 [Erythranthe guttata]
MTSNNKTYSQMEDALYTKDHKKKNVYSKEADYKQPKSEGQFKGNSKGCYRCGKLGHMKRDCRVKVACNRCRKAGHIKQNFRVKLAETEANVSHEATESDQAVWEQCFSIEVAEESAGMSSVEHRIGTTKNASDSIDYQKDWIIDSGCSHHATGNDWLLSDIHPHHGRRVIVTADNSLHPIVKEGNFDVQSDNFTSNVSLKDVYHVPDLKKNLASVS